MYKDYEKLLADMEKLHGIDFSKDTIDFEQ